MKALVLENDKTIVYKDLPLNPRKDMVRIKVEYAGICGSDIERAFCGKAYHYPLVMGHEFCGYLDEETDVLKTGSFVAVFPLIPCMSCTACQTGDYALCSNYDYLGSRSDGGFAGEVFAPAANLIPVPGHVSNIHASMTEPCAVALHGINRLSITPGDTACVYGTGPIGNFAAQWLRIRGAEVSIVEIDRKKLEIAEGLGLDTIDAAAHDPVELLKEKYRGGVTHAVEACGLPATFVNAFRSAGTGGSVLFMGNIRGPLSLSEKDISSMLRRELTILGTWNSKVTPAGKNDWSTALEHMDRDIECAGLISHTPGLSEGADIFSRIYAREEYFNKVIFKVA